MSYISLYEMGKWRDIFLEIITIINSQQEWLSKFVNSVQPLNQYTK